MYQDLKKLHYTNEGKARSVYQARVNDATAVSFDIAGSSFFYWMPPDVYRKILDIERLDRSVCNLTASIPENAISRFLMECMIDEIVLTNEIEGVISTRKEVELALEALKKHDRCRRFQGIVNKYNSLFSGQNVSMKTLEDIRELYNDLVFDEVVEADPSDAPDGDLFRRDSVRIVDAASRVLHESALSEKQIREELECGLQLYNNDSIEPLIRAALFHFIFAYIHPFYDGNGRMNRFISSQLVCKESSRWAGLRLSFSVKENMGYYYKAFNLAEHPLNRGDLVPFIITFLDISLDALKKTNESLLEKNQLLNDAKKKLYGEFGSNPKMDIDGVGQALLQGTLFTTHGLTAEEIATDAHISIPTFHKRLDEYKASGLLKSTRIGRKKYFQIDINQL